MNAEVLNLYERHESFKPGTFDALDLEGPVLYQKGADQVFYHSGDLGDIIYALPTIRALGGGTLLLGPEVSLPAKIKLRQKMSRKTVDMMKSLLELQPYIRGVDFVDHIPDATYDLNMFREELFNQGQNMRKGQRMLNLAECHLKRFQLPLAECENRWLVVDKETKIKGRSVAFHRSGRWRNPDFPWQKVVDEYKDQAFFVGLELEHDFFCADFGADIPFIKTNSFLELARLIAGTELYVGNQSLPYAICEGLKKNSLLEVWQGGPNCLFQRKNANYGLGKNVYIPKLKPTMTQEKLTSCPVCDHDKCEPVRTKADIVRCLQCQMVYLRTRMTPSSMVQLYQSYADGDSHMKCPEQSRDIAASGLKRDYFMTYLLKHLEDRRGKLLDIGCGWGAFMANARRNGFDVMGIEVCSKMADFGESLLGLDIRTDQITDLALDGGTFDAVVALHSMEHLPYLKDSMDIIQRILKPGGIYAGIVPNFGSFCSERRKDKWKWLDPNYHYLYFTPDTLKKALHPLEIVEMHTHWGDYGPEDVDRELLATAEVPLSDDELSDKRDELNDKMLGEEIHFIARKA